MQRQRPRQLESLVVGAWLRLLALFCAGGIAALGGFMGAEALARWWELRRG